MYTLIRVNELDSWFIKSSIPQHARNVAVFFVFLFLMNGGTYCLRGLTPLFRPARDVKPDSKRKPLRKWEEAVYRQVSAFGSPTFRVPVHHHIQISRKDDTYFIVPYSSRRFSAQQMNTIFGGCFCRITLKPGRSMIVSPRMSAVSFRKVTYQYNMQITAGLSSESAVAQMVRLRCYRVMA